MDLRIIFLSSYEIILSIAFGLLTIYLVNKMLNWTLLKSNSGNALGSGNIAMGIFAGTLVVCILMFVQPSILASINTLQTMITGRETIDLNVVFISFGFFLFFYFITTVISLCVLFLAIWLYLKATINIDEIDEIKNNNIAVSIMLSLVVLGMTLFIQPSLNRFISSFVRYDYSVVEENVPLESGEIAPPMKKVNPEN